MSPLLEQMSEAGEVAFGAATRWFHLLVCLLSRLVASPPRG